MQEHKDKKYATFFEELFDDFKESLKSDLHVDEMTTDEELKQLLISIINEYENEFYNNFTEIFIYNYYKNLLNSYNNTINRILKATNTNQSFNNDEKEIILKSERADCNDVLYLYNFKYIKDSETEGKFISKITGKEIPISYQVSEIITNNDVFFRPPKGDPDLRGPHTTFSIEYSQEYWLNFKNEMLKYIEDFENNHSEDFLDDLKDYRFWLNKYRVLTTFLNQIDTYSWGGEKHVKN